jgi:hypothetical protein
LAASSLNQRPQATEHILELKSFVCIGVEEIEVYSMPKFLKQLSDALIERNGSPEAEFRNRKGFQSSTQWRQSVLKKTQ